MHKENGAQASRLSRRKSTLLNLRTNSKGSERYSTLWITFVIVWRTLISLTDPMGDDTITFATQCA